jgi:predicted PurR-regulated permease PerM
VALFVAGATVLYLARGAFLILLLSILSTYLLEPAVTLVQQHSPLGRKNRNLAIAQVCVIGTLLLGTLGYELGRPFATPTVAILRIVWLECFAGQNSSTTLATQPLTRVKD